jgi:uncharacterized protein YjbI with pentapeptide repeats
MNKTQSYCLVFLAVSLALLTWSVRVEAEIYRWIDATGTLSFGQHPPKEGTYRALQRLEDTWESTAAEDEPIAFSEQATQEVASAEAALVEEEFENVGIPERFQEVVLSAVDLPRFYLALGTTLPVAPFLENPEEEIPLLSQAYLSETMLLGADFAQTDLREASLGGAYLAEATMDFAELQRVDLVGASLQGATLQGADLAGGNLQGADLRAANLQGANLRRAILLATNVEGVDFTDADLRGADLTNAIGLTAEQIASAYTDDETQLPETFPLPVPAAYSPPPPLLEAP